MAATGVGPANTGLVRGVVVHTVRSWGSALTPCTSTRSRSGENYHFVPTETAGEERRCELDMKDPSMPGAN
jgi:hypothetical protein